MPSVTSGGIAPDSDDSRRVQDRRQCPYLDVPKARAVVPVFFMRVCVLRIVKVTNTYKQIRPLYNITHVLHIFPFFTHTCMV